MNTFPKKNDSDLQADVMDELQWDPTVRNSKIIVEVHKGIVTLTGSVLHSSEGQSAVDAAQRVKGTIAVANEIEVLTSPNVTDAAIAEAAINALEWNYYSPSSVKVTVAKGVISLSGEAEWDFQRTAATDAVRHIKGVVSVKNAMTVRPVVDPLDIKAAIQAALIRGASQETNTIDITVNCGKVFLKGTVNSRAKIQDVRNAAWSAPGVSSVVDELMIEH